ncbi:MAG: flagellar basal body rod protein FlgC [Deltaproteobacteria bacterium]|jgi:flagellar basal-body rod protein FlgC|nr:flagellar basal body rod protein FlgC [Deltaproteobacteria bacterium]MBT6434165.1 flagellar basal body rod protein FlgC [Deltaproteobacteria bacterium]
MDFFSAMEVISSGLTSQRVRLNTTSSNLANANTTRTEEGGPYRRRDPIYKATSLGEKNAFSDNLDNAMRGVEVTEIVKDQAAPRKVFDPQHPDAGEDGYVEFPNVNMVEEMVNMVMASRAYEAGVTAMRSVKGMANKAIGIGR